MIAKTCLACGKPISVPTNDLCDRSGCKEENAAERQKVLQRFLVPGEFKEVDEQEDRERRSRQDDKPARPRGLKSEPIVGVMTSDAEEIIRRAGSVDRLNYACVAKAMPGGFLFLDDDGGVRAEYEKACGKMNPTLKAQSCNGSFH